MEEGVQQSLFVAVLNLLTVSYFCVMTKYFIIVTYLSNWKDETEVFYHPALRSTGNLCHTHNTFRFRSD